MRGNAVKHYQYFIAKTSEFFKFFLEISVSQESKSMRTYVKKRVQILCRGRGRTKIGESRNAEVKSDMWHNARVIDSDSHR